MKNNNSKWTGERLETFINTEVAAEHLHRYALAMSFAKGKMVLDIACGEGYGSNLLATVAAGVTGVDISASTIGLAAAKYKKDNLKFLVGSAAEIPVSDNSVDLLVSFETLEHHAMHNEMFAEIKRVLKPDGILVISSPDKLYYSDKRGVHNEFHVKELYEHEFRDLVNKNFIRSQYFYQRSSFVSLLVPEHVPGSFKEYDGTYNHIDERKVFGQLYILAIASDTELPDTGLSVFSDDQLIGNLTNDAITKVRQTASYKLGHYLLWPLKFFKK